MARQTIPTNPERAYSGPTGQIIDVREAAQYPLAEMVGTEILGIQSPGDPRQLYIGQGVMLLTRAEMPVRYIDSATRNLYKQTKFEAIFSDINADAQPRTFVIPALSPQRGFDYVQEQEREIPMRLSLAFVFEQPDNTMAVLRPTLWITQLKQNPNDIQVIKNTKEPTTVRSEDELDFILWHSNRVGH